MALAGRGTGLADRGDEASSSSEAGVTVTAPQEAVGLLPANTPVVALPATVTTFLVEVSSSGPVAGSSRVQCRVYAHDALIMVITGIGAAWCPISAAPR